MNDLSHAHHLDDEKRRPRGWLASSGTLPLDSRSTSWSSEWEETFPLLGAAITFLAGARSAIRRKVSFWDTRISTDRGRLTRSYSSTRTSSLSIIPSLSTIRFILLCSLWYMSSAMSSNTGKTILTHFSSPVTLTFLQFAFVSFYSALFMSPVVQFSKIRRPSREILRTTLPMGAFQVGGHIFSSMAMSRIHVSTVHTIKALSPLFTVAAYALLFKVSYSARTYISLLPLTFGVMLVCTFDMSISNFVGLLCAFGSAIVFVTSNIFFKKVMPSGGSETSSSHKLDKLNLLFYSSGMAFLLMIPIWLYCNIPLFMTSYSQPQAQVSPLVEGSDAPPSAAYYLLLNGSTHFAQNILAFTILASTSPVTYSIASLIKRVAVICIAIVWFAQTVHPVQAIGIAMTFIGLYMYNQAKGDIEKGESKMRRVDAARDLRLPVTTGLHEHLTPPISVNVPVSITSAYDRSWTNPLPTTQRPLLTSEIANELSSEIGRRETMLQHHPPPNLHIKIHPPLQPIQDMTTDSYPSPPESVDSPPLGTVPLVTQNQHAINSWISKRSGPQSAIGVSNLGVQESAMVVV